MRQIKYLPLCLAVLTLCSCGKNSGSTDEKEERNPLVKTGQSYVEIKDWNKAEEAFKQAIENDPLMARPHLELAMIYQQYKPNYIHALYHYDRYLELRPDSNKAEFINEQKAKVAQALRNTLISNAPEVQKLVDQLRKLQAENAALKQQLSGGQTTQAASAPVVEQATPQPEASSTAAEPEYQIYTVVAGDTLSKIASRYYGDSGKWDIIYQANKDRMKSESDLRVGQTLVIPVLGN